ncbi:MAG: D-alanine--D-alanine ligase [Defluviitaleaceae bacterium]|nr:D-alanine--D-alanine ligase [Defluviitaleaceae bacterium]
MDKKIVALLFGGQSSEHEVSKMSAMAILAALSEEKYFVLPIYVTNSGKWLLYDGSKENIGHNGWEKFATPVILSPDRFHGGLLRLVGDRFKTIPIDVVFPIIHGRNGEDGTIQAICQLAGIPFVGCGLISSAICMDKAITKIIAASLGIAQAEHLIVSTDDLENKDSIDKICKEIRYKLGYPCFVKPANTGSSVGIGQAGKKAELIRAMQAAALHDKKIIIEKKINGRELCVAMLGNENAQAEHIGEILYATDFYDYDAKYHDDQTRNIVPADIPEAVAAQIREISAQLYRACECRGMARIDFFLEESGRVVFNEINTLPGFTQLSMYPMLQKHGGRALPELCDALINLAINSAI